MPENWSVLFGKHVTPLLPLPVGAARLEHENLYVGDDVSWHFNTTSAWRIRTSSQVIGGWSTDPAPGVLSRLVGTELVRVEVQSQRTPIDPMLTFSNGWVLEVFGDQPLDPWVLVLPTITLVGEVDW